jgi:hypothetical protein
VCFGGDLLVTSRALVEEALVQVSPSFEFVGSSFGFLSLSSLGETGVTSLGKRSDRFWVCWLLVKSGKTSLAKRSDRFYSGSRCSSCFPLHVLECCLVGSCSLVQ